MASSTTNAQESTPLTAGMDDGERGVSPAPARPREPHPLGPRSPPSAQRAAKRPSAREPTLRYRRTPIWLLILYLPTLIIPWVFTCILEKRPLGHASYTDQSGNGPTTDVNIVPVGLISLLNSINSVLVIPILSTLLAHAAVVYSMRRKAGQKLDMLQLFALADRKWSDINALWSARRRGKSSLFLWLAAALILLGAIIGPLKSLLVQFEQIASVSWADIPPNGPSAFTIGYDPEPADMARLPHDLVLQNVLGSLSTASDLEPQANLWPVNPDAGKWVDAYQTPPYRRKFYVYSSDFGENPDGFFVTALDNGTLTGVLREHAIRLNSSVHCEHIAREEFPSPCPGGRPLDIYIERPALSMSVCAPGNMTHFPFTTSRNRQEVTEELYIDFNVSPNLAYEISANDNYTLHCTASTTRGYFELGNAQNDYVYGPLIDEWPDNETLASDFNDVRGVDAYWATPTENDPPAWNIDSTLPFERSIGYPFSYEYNLATAGPLMTTAEVLFGNYSFIHPVVDNSTNMTAAQTLTAICERGTIPFSQLLHLVEYGPGPTGYCSGMAIDVTYLAQKYLEDDVDRVVGAFGRTWNSTTYAEYMLMISMYYANRAVLVQTTTLTATMSARPIYASGGTILIKPVFRGIASMIVLTILIGVQLAGLIFLAWYIYQVPTWAPALDAAAVARIGRALGDDELPPVGSFTEKDEQKLKKVDAVVGVVEESKETVDDEENRSSTTSGPTGYQNVATLPFGTDGSIIPLRPGATGIITKKLLPKKNKKGGNK
ncbi:hypothetical protein SCUP515_04844 [Seiridium cupressi]